MLLYRIAKKKFVEDLSGYGARLYGGRWNDKGYSALYTSSSLSLAMCETLVHCDKSVVPQNMFFAELELPDELIPGVYMKHIVAFLITPWAHCCSHYSTGMNKALWAIKTIVNQKGRQQRF